jgi:hypothetical protein
MKIQKPLKLLALALLASGVTATSFAVVTPAPAGATCTLKGHVYAARSPQACAYNKGVYSANGTVAPTVQSSQAAAPAAAPVTAKTPAAAPGLTDIMNTPAGDTAKIKAKANIKDPTTGAYTKANVKYATGVKKHKNKKKKHN